MAPGSSPNLGHASQRRSVTSVSKALSTCLKRGLKTNKKQKQAAEVHQILVCLCSGRVGGTGGVSASQTMQAETLVLSCHLSIAFYTGSSPFFLLDTILYNGIFSVQ